MKANSASNISALLLAYMPISPIWVELGEKPAVEVVISMRGGGLEVRKSLQKKRYTSIPTRRLPFRLAAPLGASTSSTMMSMKKEKQRLPPSQLSLLKTQSDEISFWGST